MSEWEALHLFTQQSLWNEEWSLQQTIQKDPEFEKEIGNLAVLERFFYYATALIVERFSAPKSLLPESEEESHGILQFPVKS